MIWIWGLSVQLFSFFEKISKVRSSHQSSRVLTTPNRNALDHLILFLSFESVLLVLCLRFVLEIPKNLSFKMNSLTEIFAIYQSSPQLLYFLHEIKTRAYCCQRIPPLLPKIFLPLEQGLSARSTNFAD